MRIRIDTDTPEGRRLLLDMPIDEIGEGVVPDLKEISDVMDAMGTGMAYLAETVADAISDSAANNAELAPKMTVGQLRNDFMKILEMHCDPSMAIQALRQLVDAYAEGQTDIRWPPESVSLTESLARWLDGLPAGGRIDIHGGGKGEYADVWRVGRDALLSALREPVAADETVAHMPEVTMEVLHKLLIMANQTKLLRIYGVDQEGSGVVISRDSLLDVFMAANRNTTWRTVVAIPGDVGFESFAVALQAAGGYADIPFGPDMIQRVELGALGRLIEAGLAITNLVRRLDRDKGGKSPFEYSEASEAPHKPSPRL